jgi:hypothetical protein
VPRYTVEYGGDVAVFHRDGLQTYTDVTELEVFIDGVKSPHCFRVDTDEGWAKHYIPDAPPNPNGSQHVKVERVKTEDGSVRYEPVIGWTFGKVEVRKRQR